MPGQLQINLYRKIMEIFSEEQRCPKCGHFDITYEYLENHNKISCMCVRCQYEWDVLPINGENSDEEALGI